MYRLHFLTSCPNYTHIKDTFYNLPNTPGQTPTPARRNLKPAQTSCEACEVLPRQKGSQWDRTTDWKITSSLCIMHTDYNH